MQEIIICLSGCVTAGVMLKLIKDVNAAISSYNKPADKDN